MTLLIKIKDIFQNSEIILKLFFISFIFFYPKYSYGNNFNEKYLLDIIDFGYTTRWDIEQILGKGEYLNQKYVNPSDENDSNGFITDKRNAIFYPNYGITYYCTNREEFIQGIKFTYPFVGKFGLQEQIIIGKTKVSEAFPTIDTLDYDVSLASPYWYFRVGNFYFYVDKFGSYKKTGALPDFKTFRKLTICIITNVIDKDKFFVFKNSPIYAPKWEKHINHHEMGWHDGLKFFLIPIFRLTGGSPEKFIKQGYWKEYSPKHLITYEGNYVDGMESGTFKYYDENGNLSETVNYPLIIHVPSILIIVSFIIYFINKKSNFNKK